MSAYARAEADVEVSPRSLTAARSAAVALAVAVVVVIVVLFVFVRGPLLGALGQLSGPSRTAAVIVGWAVWGVPLVASLAFGWAIRDRAGIPRALRIAALIGVVCLWLPAVALIPGRGSQAQHELSWLAIKQAPAIATSLLAGVYAGALATLLSVPALLLTLVPRLRHPAGLAHLDRVVRPLVMIVVSLLGLGGALVFGRAGPPGLAASQLWPAGQSFTMNGTYVRVLAVSHSGGCGGSVEPASALTVLEHHGCGASAPTPAGSGRQLDPAVTGTTATDVNDELVVVDAGHADGQPRYVDVAPERTLGIAVANTIIYGIAGAG
jgi:hypothetical protein